MLTEQKINGNREHDDTSLETLAPREPPVNKLGYAAFCFCTNSGSNSGYFSESRLGRATALQPFVGGYHSVGISCKQKEGYSGRITGTATTDSAKRKTTRPPGFRENARRNTKNPLRNPEGIFTIARRRHRTAPAAAIYL